MKRILIALALALGATAAVAEPTLDIQSAQYVATKSWGNAPEQTSYQSAGIVDDNAPSYPFNP